MDETCLIVEEERKYDNPFEGLGDFERKLYNGSLGPELKKFTGMRFGDVFGMCYSNIYFHDGKLIGETTGSTRAPRPGHEFCIDDWIYKAIGVYHQGFEKDKGLSSEDIFRQVFRVDLKKVEKNELVGHL